MYFQIQKDSSLVIVYSGHLFYMQFGVKIYIGLAFLFEIPNNRPVYLHCSLCFKLFDKQTLILIEFLLLMCEFLANTNLDDGNFA